MRLILTVISININLYGTNVRFNQDGGAGSSNGLLASILPSLQNRGIDTGYLMGLMGGNGNGGFFGNNGGFQDIIALIVIAAIFGNGNFGFVETTIRELMRAEK